MSFLINSFLVTASPPPPPPPPTATQYFLPGARVITLNETASEGQHMIPGGGFQA